MMLAVRAGGREMAEAHKRRVREPQQARKGNSTEGHPACGASVSVTAA